MCEGTSEHILQRQLIYLVFLRTRNAVGLSTAILLQPLFPYPFAWAALSAQLVYCYTLPPPQTRARVRTCSAFLKISSATQFTLASSSLPVSEFEQGHHHNPRRQPTSSMDDIPRSVSEIPSWALPSYQAFRMCFFCHVPIDFVELWFERRGHSGRTSLISCGMKWLKF